MNYWLIEIAAEARRGELLAQMEAIRLAEQVRPALPLHPGLYSRSMLRLADWMIAAGRDLRCRYDFRSVDCSRTLPGSLAR